MSHIADKRLCSLCPCFISIVKNAKSPYSSLQIRLPFIGRKSHWKDIKIQLRAAHSLRDLYRSIPAKGHGSLPAAEQCNLIRGCQLRRKFNAFQLPQQLQRLFIFPAVSRISTMRLIRKCPSIQIIYQRACSLVPALVFTVDYPGTFTSICVQCLYSLYKILCCPGMCFLIDIFKCPGLLKEVIINRHAVGSHADGIFVIIPISVPACFFDIFINPCSSLRIPQI